MKMYEGFIMLAAITGIANTDPIPNLGDIRLDNYDVGNDDSITGEPQVFCTDGSTSPTWSYICATKLSRTDGHTICQQLGYRAVDYTSQRPVTESDNVFITDLVCKQNYTHVFHCEHVIKNNSTPCSGENSNSVLTIKCVGAMPQPDAPYPGQVALCPPDDQALVEHPFQSVSTGIVSIYFHDQWGALSHDLGGPVVDQITNYPGNLICQQAGFQKVVPGSVRTLEAYQQAGYEFTSCTSPDRTSDHKGIYLEYSWVYTSKLSCEPKQFYDPTCTTTDTDPCFGCCYTQPEKNFVGPSAKMIVLQCMYDTFTVKDDQVPFGTKEKCAFESKTNGGNKIIEYKSVCAAGSNTENAALGWSIASPFIIIISVIAAIGITFCITKMFYKRKGYITMEPNSQD